MRFKSLHIQNFRAIEMFHVDDLSDFVLIAGPNGCGKSCVFDAIRLLKSVYGGYQANEWHQWFGEFQISLNDRSQVRRLFRNPTQPVLISAEVQLHEDERRYLQENAEQILEPLVWARTTGQPLDPLNFSATAFATEYRQHGDSVGQAIETEARQLRLDLASEDLPLALEIQADGPIRPTENRTIEVIFQTFAPDQLGIIEYHSASRTYNRESMGGVNLDVKSMETRRLQHTLYNWQSKYQNVKSDLATTYLRELVARESGASITTSDLNETLKELFQTFFPDKEYLGVQPDSTGGLNFPVRLRSGQQHDINDLSSGEKEVLYGYLRMRNSTPKYSTILLDEPELHLNPGLLRGFPDFYHRHLGRARNNQLWLVTHSDTLLRQAVGNSNYSVFHMTSASTGDSVSNQALPIVADGDLERATIDLVGDLATYRPQGKVVLFEGGGDTDIDVLIAQRLFPDVAKKVNFLSGGGKQRVRDLYDVLASTAEQVGMARRFYVVTDKDSAPWEAPPSGAHHLTWDCYHIENYLIEPAFVRSATAVLLARDPFDADEEVLVRLRDAAEELLPRLVMERLRKLVNDRIVTSIRLGGDLATENAAAALMPSIEGTYERIDGMRDELRDADWLQSQAEMFEGDLRSWLTDGSWIREYPGRLLLKRFVDSTLRGAASYEAFRNVILDQMVDDGHAPAGMARVFDIVLSDG